MGLYQQNLIELSRKHQIDFSPGEEISFLPDELFDCESLRVVTMLEAIPDFKRHLEFVLSQIDREETREHLIMISQGCSIYWAFTEKRLKTRKIFFRNKEIPNMTDWDVLIYWFGNILHDIGKVGINDKILYKVEDLEPDEKKTINRHCVIGKGILEYILEYYKNVEVAIKLKINIDINILENFFRSIIYILYFHHLKTNGYPFQCDLQDYCVKYGKRLIPSIELCTSLTSIIDEMEAMLGRRSYVRYAQGLTGPVYALPYEVALAELRKKTHGPMAGIDLNLFQLFREMILDPHYGSLFKKILPEAEHPEIPPEQHLSNGYQDPEEKLQSFAVLLIELFNILFRSELFQNLAKKSFCNDKITPK